MNSRNRDLAELFQKLAEEAEAWPVEYFQLKDREDRWQGLLFIDQCLDEAKKRMLGSTIERLADGTAEEQGAVGDENEQSCAVSAEERTLLFTFLQPSSREE